MGKLKVPQHASRMVRIWSAIIMGVQDSTPGPDLEPGMAWGLDSSWMLPGPLSGCLGVDVAPDVAGEAAAQDAGLVRRTMDERVDLPRAPKLGLEPVPLRRLPFQFKELPRLDRVSELHVSVDGDPGLNHQVADLEFRVAGTDLNLQRAGDAAASALSVRRNLQKHRSVDDGIVRRLEGNAAVHLVDNLRFPGSRIAVQLARRREPGLDGGKPGRPGFQSGPGLRVEGLVDLEGSHGDIGHA